MAAAEILIHLGGGVALLLWGVRMVRKRLLRAFGEALTAFMRDHAAGRGRGLCIGLGLTTLLQSSAATAMIAAAFAGGGIISAVAALGVMLGADIGSSLVVKLLTANAGWLAPLALLAGVAGFMTARSRRIRNIARAVLGLGFVLLALQLILKASAPIREAPGVIDALHALAGAPLLAFALAAILTLVAHSSIAMVLLFASFAAGGVISLPLALALVLGANLGGALVPAVLTARAAPEARRVAIGNLLMRGSGAFGCLFAAPHVVPWLQLIDADPGRAAVNFHVAFNLCLAFIFLPLLGPVDSATRFLVKDSGHDRAGEGAGERSLS